MDKRSIKLGSGLQLAYREQGEGTPVVLLHGFCGSGAYWDKVVPALAARARVIVPDQRGHGASSAPEGSYSMETLAGDVIALLDALDLSSAVVLGHSYGGYSTLALAEAAPERLKGFGLIHSTAYPDDEKGKEGRQKSMTTIAEQGLQPFLNGLIPRLFAPEHMESMPQEVDKAMDIGRGTDPQAAIATLQGMRDRPDRRHVLEAAEIPVLLLAGGKDQVVPVEKAFAVSGPHIRQELMESSGHMGMMETPHAMIEKISSFLRTIK
ncbi:alpha/beta fold hydrolase [Paenibacillus thalictri]|uniref:Alpha/beta fold hydrolase n=1 Tax=Paenibacillus thalictri TaxID=2527873 RepID=A0A4Q9DGF7_9BACL|nr:alpha/beta fold hydrolase [Paenibacillus thalictri]TBL68282.1 alpha/beta fold hydrolase [Paenibacillus thalictri]